MIAPVIAALPHLKTIVLVGGNADDKATLAAFPGRAVHRFEDVIAAASDAPFAAPTVSDEVAFWLYTSGRPASPRASSTSTPI